MSAGIYSSKTNTRQQRMEIVRFAQEADITDKMGTTMASNLQIYQKRLVHCNLESLVSVQLFFLKHFLQSVCFLWKYCLLVKFHCTFSLGCMLIRKSCLFGISRVHKISRGGGAIGVVEPLERQGYLPTIFYFFFTFYCSLGEVFFCIWQPEFLETIDTNQILKASASPDVHFNIKLSIFLQGCRERGRGGEWACAPQFFSARGHIMPITLLRAPPQIFRSCDGPPHFSFWEKLDEPL